MPARRGPATQRGHTGAACHVVKRGHAGKKAHVRKSKAVKCTNRAKKRTKPRHKTGRATRR